MRKWFCTMPLGFNNPRLTADHGSIAALGDVNNSSITIGFPPEVVADLVRQHGERTEEQKKLIAKLEAELNLNQRQVQAALEILGEANVRPEHLAAKLVEIAERFKALQTIVATQSGDAPTIAALKVEAKKAIDAGDLAQADAVLGEVESEQRRALDRLAVSAAETSAQRGEIALTRLRYVEAAEHFANAAAVLPPRSAHEVKRIGYLDQEATALYMQGDEFGDIGALLSAIERYKRLLEVIPRARVPLDWAATQNNLGNVLRTLGERESGTENLTESVAAYREALQEFTRARVPLDWAMTQMNLGGALLRLGELESGTARLEEAVEAYREALKEFTRARVPPQWAMTQVNLGVALLRLGERECGTARLKEAVTSYREALKEYTRERVPFLWAQTQENLALVYYAFFDKDRGPRHIDDALEAIDGALEEYRAGRAAFHIEKSERLRGKIIVAKRKLACLTFPFEMGGPLQS